MSYEYKCPPVIDVFIYSGVVPNLEEKFDKENDVLKKGTPVYQKAFQDYQDSFEKHRKEIKFDLVSFVSLVDRNMSVIKEAGGENVSVVAKKLNDLAQEKLNTEGKWNGATRFFHKLGQLFKGHGFRTEGAWAKEFADKLQSVKANEVLKAVQGSFNTANSWNSLKIPEQYFPQINQMQREAFKEVVQAYVSGPVPDGMHNPYSDFYKMLNLEKQQWLVEGILAQPSWPAQVVKLGVQEFNVSHWAVIKPSPEMIKKVQSEPKLFFAEYEKNRSVFYKRAAKPLMEWAVIDLIDKKDTQGVRKFIEQTDGRIGCIHQLLENPEHLKPEHVDWLKTNFNLNM